MPYSFASSGLLILTKEIPCHRERMKRWNVVCTISDSIAKFSSIHLLVAFVIDVLQFGDDCSRLAVFLIVCQRMKEKKK